MGLGLTAAALAPAVLSGIGAAVGSKKSKLRLPQPKDVKDLLQDAIKAIPEGIKAQEQFGASFLTSQIDAQRQALPGFFEDVQAGRQASLGLAGRVFAGSPEQRLGVQAQRSAQAARGLALSPSSALAEGLQQAAQQVQFERGNIDLFSQAAQFSRATPFGVSALQAPNLSQLLGIQQGQEQQRLSLGAGAAQFGAQQQDAQTAARGAFIGQLGAGAAGAFGAGALGIPGFGAAQGFGAAFGGPTAGTFSNINFQNQLQQLLSQNQQPESLGQVGAVGGGF